MKNLFSIIAAMAVFAAAFTSCEKKPVAEETVKATAVSVTPSPVSVVAGQTVQLAAEVLPANTTDKSVLWGSRAEEIATVDQTGLVSGVAVGEAELWAKCGECTCKVIVTVTAAPIRVKTITLNKTELALFVGKTEKLTYSTDPENPTFPAAAWTSSAPSVAAVADDGTVTAAAEGTATITLTIDEKTATCSVTVSVPAISSITLPYLKDVATTVSMVGEGFKAGDKVSLADYFGGNAVTADVKNVTTAGAEFDFPSSLTKDRTYVLSVMRDGAKQAEALLRADNDMVQFGASLGFALTATDQVVPDSDRAALGIHTEVTRGGYVSPAAVFEFNADDKTFDASASDLKLCTFTVPTPAQNPDLNLNLNLNRVGGIKDLSPLRFFNLTEVDLLQVCDTGIEELDMTLFPNCTKLYGWGDTGVPNRFKKVNFGEAGVDPESKLVHIQLERQYISGPIDLSNLPANLAKLDLSYNQITGTVDLRKFTDLHNGLNLSDNNIGKIELGTATGNADTDPAMLALPTLNAKNNKLTEIDISNCGRLRKLYLEGNKIERARLLNNAVKTPAHNADPDAWFPYVYILKNKEDFNITWATAAEAQGRERHIHVEHYWYRNFSESNKNENGSKASYGKWVNNNPIVQAYADGFKVTDYYYVKEGDPGGAVVKHVHEPGGSLCPAELDAE